MFTTYKNFKISATLNGAEINPAWGEHEPRNRYTVTVRNMDTGKNCRFAFWDSLSATRAGVVELDRDNLLNAFYCFVDDATTAADSFHNFCMEYGYSEGSRSAEKIYKECVQSGKKWARVSGLGESGLYRFLYELQEIAG